MKNKILLYFIDKRIVLIWHYVENDEKNTDTSDEMSVKILSILEITDIHIVVKNSLAFC